MKLLHVFVLASIAVLNTSHVTAKRTIKRILHVSDVHLNISQNLDTAASDTFPIAYYQDAPIRLLESALEYAQQVLPNPDLLLYTGDHAAHGDFTDEYIARAVETNVNTFEKYYPVTGNSTGLETTAITGNADGNPDYHMEVTDPDTESNPSIELISSVWKHFLSNSNFESFNRRGYLQYHLDEKLVVLTLNTVPYSIKHVPDTSSVPDPFNQFAWLNATLVELRRKGQFAYIAGHIAPFVDSYGGQSQWHPNYIIKYKALVESFADVVKAQFFGHVHSIEFRIPTFPKSTNTSAQVPLFVSGSISPLFGNNPSFMVWDFDATTYEVLDYYVYGTNISTNAPQLNWTLLFQATTAYGVPSLTSSALTDLYNRMVEDPALLEKYYWNMKAQAHKLPPCTTCDCRAKTLCTMKWFTTSNEFTECVKTTTTRLNRPTNIRNPTTTQTPAVQSSASSKEKDASQSPPMEEEIESDLLTTNKQNTSAVNASTSNRQVYETIGITVLICAVGITVVLGALFALKRYGVLERPNEQERHYENV